MESSIAVNVLKISLERLEEKEIEMRKYRNIIVDCPLDDIKNGMYFSDIKSLINKICAILKLSKKIVSKNELWDYLNNEFKNGYSFNDVINMAYNNISQYRRWVESLYWEKYYLTIMD